MWDSGVVFGKFLEHTVESGTVLLQGKKVVELGSDCGLVGGFRVAALNCKGKRAQCIDWKNLKCPQQLGSVECGYYIMKYMHEICMKYHDLTSLDKAFGDTSAYSSEEVDNISQIWVEYFLKEYI